MRSPLMPPFTSLCFSAFQLISDYARQIRAGLQGKLKQVGLVGIAIALLCLTGCGKQGPDNKLVRQAIALEFGQAQIELSQQLRTQVPTFRIERVEVTDKTPLRIEGLAAYRIQGQYDASVKFPDQRYRQDHNAFDVYLQQQGDTDNWRLAIPQEDAGTASQTWETYLLFDAGARS